MDAVRFSHLRAYGRSAAHGHHARTAAETDPSYAMERGTAVHALIFGNKRVLGYPGAQRRGKEYDAFAAANDGAEILTAAEFAKAERMADAVRQCKLAEPWMRGNTEQRLSFDWLGMPCRVTPDVKGDGFLTELKTAATADPERFKWHALRMCYHAQLRFQEYGAGKVADHMIVCVESAEPYPVTVFRIEPRALEAADKMLHLWAERLKGCEQSKQFPPYAQSVVPLDVPEDEEELIFNSDGSLNLEDA